MRKPVSILLRSIFVFILSSCLFSPQSIGGEPLGRITVEAGSYTRIDTPVSLDLSGVPLGFPGDEIRLVEVKGSQRIEVPVQFEAGSPPRLWWVLSGTTEPGGERTYELVNGSARAAPGVSAKQDKKVLQIQKDDAKVLNYNHAIVPGPAGQSELYNRGGFIHPLWSPAGSVLTNIHPKDHYHHLGIWMPWTNTVFEGEEVDFWNLAGRKDEDVDKGTVRFNRFLLTTSGPVYGGFQAEQDHVALETSSGEKVVLKEVWDVRV
ncbi:MAG: DUF6807 family protein, partial [Planctomycetota bacterium]